MRKADKKRPHVIKGMRIFFLYLVSTLCQALCDEYFVLTVSVVSSFILRRALPVGQICKTLLPQEPQSL